VEKDKITPEGLPPCPICQLEPLFFKLHAYRERRFLLIIEMLVKSIFCTLVRFRCTGCGKIFTQYPEFAIPHKHCTRQSIESFSAGYVKDDQKTYKSAIMTDDLVAARFSRISDIERTRSGSKHPFPHNKRYPFAVDHIIMSSGADRMAIEKSARFVRDEQQMSDHTPLVLKIEWP
jgi:hypothetical protein